MAKKRSGKRKPAKGLSPEHEKFAQYVALGESQAEAVRKVWKHYRTKSDQACCVRGSKLMMDVKIRERVNRLKPEVADTIRTKFKIDAEEVIQRLAAIGMSSLEDFVTIDKDGHASIDMRKADKLALRGLNSIKVKKVEKLVDAAELEDGVPPAPEIEGEEAPQARVLYSQVEVRLPDRTPALRLLGQHLGVFKEDESPTVNVYLGDRLRAAIERKRALRKADADAAE